MGQADTGVQVDPKPRLRDAMRVSFNIDSVGHAAPGVASETIRSAACLHQSGALSCNIYLPYSPIGWSQRTH